MLIEREQIIIDTLALSIRIPFSLIIEERCKSPVPSSAGYSMLIVVEIMRITIYGLCDFKPLKHAQHVQLAVGYD